MLQSNVKLLQNQINNLYEEFLRYNNAMWFARSEEIADFYYNKKMNVLKQINELEDLIGDGKND